MQINYKIFILFTVISKTHCPPKLDNIRNENIQFISSFSTPIQTINLENFDQYFFSQDFLNQIKNLCSDWNNLRSKEHFPRGIQVTINTLNNTILFLKTFTIKNGKLVLHILINDQADYAQAMKEANKKLNEIKKKQPQLNNFHCNSAELNKAFQALCKNQSK